MKLFHWKISFYLQWYLSSFREKHLQTKGERRKKEGLMNGVTPRSQQHASTSRPNAGQYCWLTHTGWLRRENLWGVPMKATEPPLVQAPPLLCSFPILRSPPCQLRAANLLPFSRAGTNQHWSHSQCNKGAEITSKRRETAKQHKAIFQGHSLQHD